MIAKPGGGYQTVDIQNGQVTAVSPTAITLKSADGYARSYVITNSTLVDAQRDGIGLPVKVGNQASVLATVSGSTATAVTVRDRTLLPRAARHSVSPAGAGPAGRALVKRLGPARPATGPGSRHQPAVGASTVIGRVYPDEAGIGLAFAAHCQTHARQSELCGSLSLRGPSLTG